MSARRVAWLAGNDRPELGMTDEQSLTDGAVVDTDGADAVVADDDVNASVMLQRTDGRVTLASIAPDEVVLEDLLLAGHRRRRMYGVTRSREEQPGSDQTRPTSPRLAAA